MSNWDRYQREERPRLTPGDYRVEIVSVDETESKNGNPMLVIGVCPNGSNITINHYIVKNEWFNRNMTDFFDSFNIEDDRGYLKVQYFIKESRAEKLPPWEGKIPERQELTKIEEIEDDGELPWD